MQATHKAMPALVKSKTAEVSSTPSKFVGGAPKKPAFAEKAPRATVAYEDTINVNTAALSQVDSIG